MIICVRGKRLHIASGFMQQKVWRQGESGVRSKLNRPKKKLWTENYRDNMNITQFELLTAPIYPNPRYQTKL